MRYALEGGKRIRAVICLATAEAAGAEPEAALPAAAALELVHAFSLVHDDLPALDDDDERRGRPSAHVAFGEGVALLAGDALLAEAFRLALTYQDAGAARELAEATLGMIGGQYLDITRADVPPRRAAPAQDRAAVRRVGRARAPRRCRARGSSRPRGARSGRSSGCCSRSSTTFSTATATPSGSVRRRRASWRRRRPTGRAPPSTRSRRTRRCCAASSTASSPERRSRAAAEAYGDRLQPVVRAASPEHPHDPTPGNRRRRDLAPAPSRSPGRRSKNAAACRRPGSATNASPPAATTPVEQAQQRPGVALLVEDVRSEHEIEPARLERALVRPRPGRPSSSASPFAAALRASRSSASGAQSVASTSAAGQGGRERRQAEPAAELEHRRPAEVERGDVPGEREPARPQLGPVGQELVVLEALLVDQALGILGALEHELAPADEDALLLHPASLPGR